LSYGKNILWYVLRTTLQSCAGKLFMSTGMAVGAEPRELDAAGYEDTVFL
jgi:hypothetical protein